MIRHIWLLWSCRLIILILQISGLSMPVHAQPPERFRLDLSLGFSGGKSSCFWGADSTTTTTTTISRPASTVPFDAYTMFLDITGTFNATQRLTFSAGIPFGLTIIHFDEESEVFSEETEYDESGVGDAHVEAGYQIFRERRFSPGMRLQLEVGAPTANSDLLGCGLWRAAGRAGLWKSLHHRFTLFINGSFADYFRKKDIEQEQVVSFGGGVGIGITKAKIINLQVEEVISGERKEDGFIVAQAGSDLRAGIKMTNFLKGCPKFSISVLAGGLQDNPMLLLAFKWAVLSL